MKNDGDRQPKRNRGSFFCPCCGVFAEQEWTNIDNISEIVNSIVTHKYLEYRTKISSFQQEVIEKYSNFLIRGLPSSMQMDFIPNYFGFARCQSCSQTTVWKDTEMIYPRSLPFPGPNEDLGEHIKELYFEADFVYQDSPRASAALLRLCIEELCRQLGEKGPLNTCIGNLVEHGLDTRIQQALDYCRVIGNSAVHAGKIDLKEDPSRVSVLFDLVNDIAYELITKPKEMDDKYSSLPEGSRKAIENRDKTTT